MGAGRAWIGKGSSLGELLGLRNNDRKSRRRRPGSLLEFTPPQIFLGSFLFLIFAGTLSLKLIPGLYYGEPPGWLDALFTSTSAVCVTGLIVFDTATRFTPLGQGVLLVLIQMGGLGMITFTTLIIVALGRKLSLSHEAMMSTTDVTPHINFKKLTADIFVFTFIIELIGTILLFFAWAPRMGIREALWHSLFHSISAFCNAGFSTFSNSLMGYSHDPITLIVISVLIVLGGIGFITIEELHVMYNSRRESRAIRLSLHSKLVILTTVILIFVGWAGFTLFEWNVAFAGHSITDRVVNGLFMSVTSRTAGFNSIDYGAASDRTNFLTILLMSIGGSPGSMAGGMKTTTAALIGLMALSRYRGESHVSIWGRTIPDEILQRAVGLFVLAFGILTLSIFLLITTENTGVVAATGLENNTFLHYMFEAVSAFNTVGLSMGVTDSLSVSGRWTTILLMFIGRVGPLTFSAALVLQRKVSQENFRYAYEDVVVG